MHFTPAVALERQLDRCGRARAILAGSVPNFAQWFNLYVYALFEKGFIKAEVISFADLVALGSVAEARAKGKARLEGEDYVMQDGDVVEFRFNN